jgi:hypothetical protein
MLSKKILAALLAGLVLSTGAYAEVAGGEAEEAAKALKLAQEAVTAGKAGNAADLVAKASEAKTHAINGVKIKSTYALEEALRHLDAAVAAGGKGETQSATEHAQAAIDVLNSIAPVDPNQP